MSSLSSLNRNILRLSGLNSGIDTESLVQSMLSIETQKLNKQFRTQTKLQWMIDAHKEVNNTLRKLKDEYSTVLKQEQNMLSKHNYNKYSATLRDNSDATYVSVSAEPGAKLKEGGVTINKITQLATGASVTSGERISGKDGAGINTSMSMYEIATVIKNATYKNPMSYIDEDGNRVGNEYYQPGKDLPINNKTGNLEFTLDGVKFEISAHATLDTVINTINANVSNIKVSFSQKDDTFTIESLKEGKDSTLSLEDSGFLFALGINRFDVKEGQNAKFEMNGVEMEASGNKFTLDGINYTLMQTTPKDAGGNFVNQNIGITVTRDLDHTVNMIKKYVESYNEMVTKIRDLLGEKPDRSYYPLTDDEKAELSEKEIEKWESEAKKGLLRNNSQLSSLLSQMRLSFYTTMPGASKSLADMGLEVPNSLLSSSSFEKSMAGLIEIDEMTLREALKEDTDMVINALTADSSTGDVNGMGFVKRVNTMIDTYIKDNEYNTQYYTELGITRAKERYIEMSNAIYRKQEQLYKKFTAMETALSSLNSQSSWLQSQLGSM